jgi:hypothetical protein
LQRIVPYTHFASKSETFWRTEIGLELDSVQALSVEQAKIAFFEKARLSPQYGTSSFVVTVNKLLAFD